MNASYNVGKSIGFFIAEIIFATMLFFIIAFAGKLALTLSNYLLFFGISLICLSVYIFLRVN